MDLRVPEIQLESRLGGGDYIAGKELLGAKKYDQAIVRFDRVVAAKGGQRRRRALLEGLRTVQAREER